MALQAQRPDICEIAFPAAFHYRNNMVGIPQAFSRTGAHPPIQKSFQPRRAAQPPEMAFGVQAIHAAGRAHSVIPFQYLFAKIARIGAQTPFLHAPDRTKAYSAFGNFQIAPAAQIAAIRAPGKCTPVRPTARHGSVGTHFLVTSKNTKKGTRGR